MWRLTLEQRSRMNCPIKIYIMGVVEHPPRHGRKEEGIDKCARVRFQDAIFVARNQDACSLAYSQNVIRHVSDMEVLVMWFVGAFIESSNY